MRKVPSIAVVDPYAVPSEIVKSLRDVLEKEISFDRFGTDSTNLVRASTDEFAVSYSPVGSVAFILSLTLRK